MKNKIDTNSLSHRFLLRVTGVAAILTGLVYVYSFKIIEAEIRTWGMYAIFGGLLLIVFSLKLLKNLLLRAFIIINLAILLLAQILPIILWLALTPITDHPEGYIGNRFYAFPHIIVFILSLVTIVNILKIKERISSKDRITSTPHNSRPQRAHQ